MNEDVDGSSFGGYCFQFLWRVSAKTFAPTFGVVLGHYDSIVSYTSICFQKT